MDTEIDAVSQPLFRPVKRRKFLRRRGGDDDAVDESHRDVQVAEAEPTSDGQDSAPAISDEADTSIHATDILKLRKPFRPRKGGIEFSATSRSATGSGLKSTTNGTGSEDAEALKIQAMCDRFTAHTGQKVDVDNHMMAYIESELAKRQQRSLRSVSPNADLVAGVTATTSVDESSAVLADSGPKEATAAVAQRQPASLGKLYEIDLGQDAKLQNIARTQAATRRLAGEPSPALEEETMTSKPRLGKDGKPWRHRKGRTSEDIERDRLVEEILRESKLEVYDEPEMEQGPDDQAADDRIAEQFRRDFLDAIQSRRRAARARTATKTAKTNEAPKGPKLGGSRSARAAMREAQNKAGQK